MKKDKSMFEYFSKTVQKTKYKNEDVFVNTITRKILPINASLKEFRDNFFMEGMEHQAIEHKITSIPEHCQITIVPTWECNLRCSHCVILNKLVKKDEHIFDSDKIVDFVKRFKDHYSFKKVHITFVGGEPLLHINRLDSVISGLVGDDIDENELPFSFWWKHGSFSLTTNLAIDITAQHIDLLKKIHNITISIDGDHLEHNLQRKSLDGSDAFVKTIQNLKLLMKNGFQKRISVQSALRDEFLTTEHKQRYYANLMRIGVLPNRIKFGCLHPTVNKSEPSEAFKSVLGSGVIKDICCRYRMYAIVIDRNQVFTDFYSWSKVSDINDDISVFDNRRKDRILDTLPVLKDKKCRECPVVGCCWGGCTSGLETFNNPSRYCNQQALIDETSKLAKNGTLINSLNSRKMIHE